jgi:hypothetical protein
MVKAWAPEEWREKYEDVREKPLQPAAEEQ